MRFENGNGVKGFGDVNHNDHKKPTGRMSYITVTENAVKWWITVQGLNHHEVSCMYVCFAGFHMSFFHCIKSVSVVFLTIYNFSYQTLLNFLN